jgi:hypothetical protein
MISNEQKTPLNNSSAESLHNSQVSQRSDFVSSKPHLHHSNSASSKSFSSSQAK